MLSQINNSNAINKSNAIHNTFEKMNSTSNNSNTTMIQSGVAGKREITINLNQSVLHSITGLLNEHTHNVLKWASEKYDLDFESALREYNLDNETNVGFVSSSKTNAVPKNKEKTKKEPKEKKIKEVKIQLPYTGPIEGCCKAIKKNNCLFTQCETKIENGEYCPSCAEECNANDDGKPNAGNIQDRESVPYMDYKDRKNARVISYDKFMKKKNMTKDQVLEYTEKHGITLDESHFLEVVRKAGRPPSKNSKKEKKVESTDSDLFGSLKESVTEKVPASNKEKPEKKEKAEKKEKPEKNQEKKETPKETDDNVDVVKKFTYEGVKYLKSKKTHIVYNMEQDVVGKWNPETAKMEWNNTDKVNDEEESDESDLEDLDEDEDDGELKEEKYDEQIEQTDYMIGQNLCFN